MAGMDERVLSRVRGAVDRREVQRLFVDVLGWDNFDARVDVDVDGSVFRLEGIAQRSVQVFECRVRKGAMPPQTTRRRIDSELAKLVREHLVVFSEEGERGAQVWQWVKREMGRPAAVRERLVHAGHEGRNVAEAVAALHISTEEAETLTHADVLGRLKANFDAERPTKRFYERFKIEHAALVDRIRKIPDEDISLWYASVVLNRLMFVYFVQKKGFLDGDTNYLRNRFEEVKRRQLEGNVFSFYRAFLLKLFHDGLNTTEPRPEELTDLIGDVPYLNGGLFDRHAIEIEHPDVDIDDEAFEAILTFFEAFTWTIDDRPVSSEREINPDVLGYIFERFVNYTENKRREKGAYYTKEDVTGYMTGVAVVPAVLDALVEQHAPLLETMAALVAADPDRYLYASAKSGLAGAPLTLPGEANAAADARRHHVAAERERLAGAELKSVDDIVTSNLDVRQLAVDFLQTADAGVIAAAWKRLNTLRVLDPTCGSGAFLFAALAALEPLYTAVLIRMQGLIEEETTPAHFREAFASELPENFQDLNLGYWITKRIIAQNLFGADLLEEATEICKLRLYLRLVAKLNRRSELKPLPDIDFNIVAGNAIVGFATEQHSLQRLAAGGQTVLDIGQDFDKVREHARAAAKEFEAFRALAFAQDGSGDLEPLHEAKAHLREKLDGLRRTLDAVIEPEADAAELAALRAHERPLHWYVDFYEVLANGGFDVIVGNPPYIKRKDLDYDVSGYETDDCPDIYATVLERSLEILRPGGRLSMIVMLSAAASPGFQPLRNVLHRELDAVWYAHFGRIPDYLFSDDVRVRNTIVTGKRRRDKSDDVEINTTQLHRWLSAYRPHLFEALRYVKCDPKPFDGLIPKATTRSLVEGFAHACSTNSTLATDMTTSRGTGHPLHFKTNAYNWLAFSLDEPPCVVVNPKPGSGLRVGQRVPQSKVKKLYFREREDRDLALVLLNGKIMWAWWRLVGYDLDVTMWMAQRFPVAVSAIEGADRAKLLELSAELAARLPNETSYKLNAGLEVHTYKLLGCRDITDVSDQIFLRHLPGIEWDDLELVYAETVKGHEELDSMLASGSEAAA